ncbi:MAG: MGMT family protein [Proteobacteria bacterium]|nr:MGMT family protein [Pseudomonadota bacterium]
MILKGTKFQIKVWEFLKTIPKGTVTTYSKVAEAIGYPKAVRAVANAIGNNPNPIIVPCHRVIRANGTIGGYSGIGGIKKKKALLRKENIKLNQLLKYVN